MSVNLSRFAGFCGGVKRAFDMVIGLDMSKMRQPVLIMGSLVHNEDTIRKVEEKGISSISREDFLNNNYDSIGTLIISAHGVGPDIYSLIKERGIEMIDTTCPKVAQVQKLSSFHSEKGNEVVLVGDRDHKEVKGIFEWGGKMGNIVSDRCDLKSLSLDSKKRIVIISQTTQGRDFFEEVCSDISKKYPEVEIQNTICLATEKRQEETKRMAQENEIMVIIGSPDSANSNRLFEVSKKINPKSYFIERADDIDSEWFKKAKNVGVSAGASTPTWIIEEVVEKIGKIIA